MYLVYRTTNKITNEYYIGVHKKSAHDYYLGSGLRIKRSIKKYGRENFHRETLFEFEKSDEAFEKERQVLNEHLGDSKCLNIAEGGCGGSNFKGRKHSEKTKQKISKSRTNIKLPKKTKEILDKERQSRYEKNGGTWFSLDTIEKIRDKAKKRRLSEESKRKISDSLRRIGQIDKSAES